MNTNDSPDAIGLLLDAVEQPFETFQEDVQKVFQLDYLDIYERELTLEEETKFSNFLDSLIKADSGLFQSYDSSEADLQKFYFMLLAALDDSKKCIWLGFGEKPASPRIFVQFNVSWQEDSPPLKQLAFEMMPYLKTQGKHLLGILFNFDGVTIAWLDKVKQNKKLKESHIRLYSFRWSWMALKMMIDWRRSSKDFIPSAKRGACKLLLLIEFIKKIMSEEELDYLMELEENGKRADDTSLFNQVVNSQENKMLQKKFYPHSRSEDLEPEDTQDDDETERRRKEIDIKTPSSTDKKIDDEPTTQVQRMKNWKEELDYLMELEENGKRVDYTSLFNQVVNSQENKMLQKKFYPNS